MSRDRDGGRSRPLPPNVAEGAAEALGESDADGAFVSIDPVGGGCIHPSARIRTRSGAEAFLKWSRSPGPAGFGAEAGGLTALSRRGGLRVPDVLAFRSGGEEERGWLLLEFVEQGPPTPETPERLGSGLAHLHRPMEGAAPGWEEDGFIGSLPQPNRVDGGSWPRFWKEMRLAVQWEAATPHFDADTRRSWERLMDVIELGLEGIQDDGLSLLHGDLWSGNVIVDAEGAPALVDPAAYRGHREVDLAMMELFGGFRPAVIERYRSEAPLLPGYQEVRRDIYQLYPLLVHVNLFGRGYVSGVVGRVRRLLAQLEG